MKERPDLDELINDIQKMIDGNPRSYIRYIHVGTLMDILCLLKEQKAVVIPHRNYQYLSDYWCKCGWHLGKKGDVKFCPECGKLVKWDE